MNQADISSCIHNPFDQMMLFLHGNKEGLFRISELVKEFYIAACSIDVHVQLFIPELSCWLVSHYFNLWRVFFSVINRMSCLSPSLFGEK